MTKFTVKAAMSSGKKSPTYGTEYYVQVDEMDDTATLWFKTAPKVGSEIELEQVKGVWKKVKVPYTPKSQTTDVAKKQWTPMKKDNSDGMRQGMCINNAANYVNSLEFKKALTDKEWAELVHSYATALYVLGDLKAPAEAEKVSELYDN